MAANPNKRCEWCNQSFKAKPADIKRGWARFCSKSCKAKHQEKRTGQHAEFVRRDTERSLEPHFFSEDAVQGNF